jgi:hypothetical protein
MRWSSAWWLRICWIPFAVSLWRDNFKSRLYWRLNICRDIKTFLLNDSVIRHVPLMRAWLRYYFLYIAQVIPAWGRTLDGSLLLQSSLWATWRYYLLDLLCGWTLDHWHLFTASSSWEILLGRCHWYWLLGFIGLCGDCLTCWDEAWCCWISRIDIVVVRNCIDILSIWNLLSPRYILIWCWSDAKIIYIGIDHQLYRGYLAALKILLLS